ncbi:MAG: transposase [Gammaproteobacteria bacterium]
MSDPDLALGPRTGQKVLSVQTVPTREPPPAPARCVDEQGFSLHAEVCCAAHQRMKLGSQGQGWTLLGAEHATLCRYIARPAIANERLALNRAGQVVLTLKTLSRGHDLHRHVTPGVFAATRRPGSPSTAPSRRARARSQAQGGACLARRGRNARLRPESFRACRSTPIPPQRTTPRRPYRGACPHELGHVAQTGVRYRYPGKTCILGAPSRPLAGPGFHKYGRATWPTGRLKASGVSLSPQGPRTRRACAAITGKKRGVA